MAPIVAIDAMEMEGGLAQLLEIRLSERPLVDLRHIDALCRQLGPRGAEAHVTERVEAIADILADIDWARREGPSPAIGRAAERAARLADEVGLTSLARVSRDLAEAAGRADPAAFGAVWARLVRVGDLSLAQVWQAPGLSL